MDIIRSSAVFHSFIDFSRAVDALNRPGSRVKIVRTKDRVTKPLPSGYRDVLLNVKVEGCEMVMELQLHLKDVIAVKEEAHRIYDMLRTFGWEKDEIDVAPQSLSGDEVKQARRSSFGGAALQPLEISLTGELEEVGSQRQLLTDDDLFQVDCGGSSGPQKPGSDGWFW